MGSSFVSKGPGQGVLRKLWPWEHRFLEGASPTWSFSHGLTLDLVAGTVWTLSPPSGDKLFYGRNWGAGGVGSPGAGALWSERVRRIRLQQSPGLRASLPQSRGPGLVASPFSGRDLAGGPGEEVFNRCGMEQVLTTAGSRTAHRSAGAAVQGLRLSSGVCLYPRWGSP